ncbi:MAG: amidohydrolase, partial [Dinghuibacter sp.]|nr:amidohydrolase [Dinghuibacter sp.]
MVPLLQRIKTLSHQWHTDTIEIRRYLHAHPELSYQEHHTCAFIAAKLTEWGIPHEILATTGVMATIKGKNATGKTTCLRSDHDALPIQEQNDLPFKSTNPGVAHMCGHDAHTACNLTAARILHELNTEWDGEIKIIFQPGEETVREDGTSGAASMMEEGGLLQQRPVSIIAQHVNPAIPAGKVAVKPGIAMASVDIVSIIVKGKGGHGAMPHECIDPVTTAANILVALQHIVSRRANPFQPTVLSFGKISGGEAFNVIPGEVELLGTLRAYDEEWRNELHTLIPEISASVAAIHGATVECVVRKGPPHVSNNEALAARVKQAAIEYMGETQVETAEAYMFGEDFAHYALQMPGCFYWLGVRNEEQGITSGLHS